MWIIILFINFSCSNIQQKIVETPEEYRSKSQIELQEYHTDSLKMTNDFLKMIKNHEGDFYSYEPKYVDTLKSTVAIDTILLNSSENKAIILLTTESLLKDYREVIDKKLTKMGSKILFDGFCFFAKKKDDKWTYYSYSINVGKYHKINECIERLREIYFHELSSMKQKDYNRYNVDDVRIWEEPIWKKF